MYLAKPNQYPTYALNIHDIHLRSGTTLPASQPPVITEIPDSTFEQPIEPIEHIPISEIISKELVL